MATTMKGIYKGFKFITQIFVVKEREMDIGHPTDVKHVAHIGWDGPPGSGPSWMNEFRPAPNFSTSLGNVGPRRDVNPTSVESSSWSNQDNDVPKRSKPKSSNNISSSEITQTCKKNKRRKTKSSSSPQSSSSSATRTSRKPKPVGSFSETEVTPTVQV